MFINQEKSRSIRRTSWPSYGSGEKRERVMVHRLLQERHAASILYEKKKKMCVEAGVAAGGSRELG